MDKQITVSKAELANAFAEWVKRRTEKPELFAAESCSHGEYGADAAEYLCTLIEELRVQA